MTRQVLFANWDFGSLDAAALRFGASGSDEHRFGFDRVCDDRFLLPVNSHNTIRDFKACKEDK